MRVELERHVRPRQIGPTNPSDFVDDKIFVGRSVADMTADAKYEMLTNILPVLYISNVLVHITKRSPQFLRQVA